MKHLTRRAFIKASALGFGAVAISTGLQGCFLTDDNEYSTVAVRFDHGVASGDPLTDRIIVWTRVSPQAPAGSVLVTWEVATDSNFADVIHRGTTGTTAARDYTVKVDVQNLDAGTTYYYRFISNGTTSPVGTLKTLPEGAVSSLKFAVFSCANYPYGYFHVYAEAARVAGLDAVIHLGDYIYEYPDGYYPAGERIVEARRLTGNNAGELLTLENYRQRYALYRTDENLQTLHASVPFIAVWDDHEVANDTWREGAENHDPELGEGDFEARKLAALQAYFEWMPIRPAAADDLETIYRTFQFGDLATLYMLDTRVIARDEQLDYNNYIDNTATPPTFNQEQFEADVNDANRTLLGSDQLLQLQADLAASTTTWQVLGQQVLMGRMTLPVEMLQQFLNPNLSTFTTLFLELLGLKGRQISNSPPLTDDELERITNVVPYNLDAWDGYPAEREALLATCRTGDKNLIVLAGDTHNAWANELRDANGNAIGVEFATSSVSSPGLEEYLSLESQSSSVVSFFESGLVTLVDDLKYLNATQRGFLLVTLTHDEARADWQFVTTAKTPEYSLDTPRSRSFRTLPGSSGRTLQAL